MGVCAGGRVYIMICVDVGSGVRCQRECIYTCERKCVRVCVCMCMCVISLYSFKNQESGNWKFFVFSL